MRKRKLILLLSCLFLFIIGQAQVSKTINVTTPGTLSTLLTSTELSTVSNLTVTGTIDARDFKTMRDNMPRLAKLDIVNITIIAYTGSEGTQGTSNITYLANTIPQYSFSVYYAFPPVSKTSLTSVTMPQSITGIGDEAFAHCSNITGTLSIPSSVINIGEGAFFYCTGFNGPLIIPSSVTTIANGAFMGCSNFTGSLNIPASVKTLKGEAFRECSGLNGMLTIPYSLTKIEETTFMDCSGLTGSLNIPSSVDSIGDAAFSGCSSFSGILTLPPSITSIEANTFSGCSGLTGLLTIPSSVTTILDNAFSGCSGFTGSLTIPSSVTLIGGGAFSGCSGFNGSLTLSSSMTTINESTFKGCSELTGPLNIPISITRIFSDAFMNCKGFNGTLTIPSSVIWIDVYAFYGCNGFTGSLTIPSSINTINDHVFSGCSGFNGSLNLPSSIYSIGVAAFSGCSGLTGSVTVPEFTIEYGASIGDSAFLDCKGFNGTLSLPKTIPYPIGNAAFSGCSGFTGSLIIPTAAKSIGASAFSGCRGFNGSLLISSTITSIENNTFKDCSGFNETLTIPASVTSIGSNSFTNCSHLKKINAYGINPTGISMGTTVFSGISTTTCHLSVPVTKKSLYATAAQWKDFINISEGVPVTLTTGGINSIYSTNPTGNGNITNIDPNDPTQYGVVWSTTPNPTIELSAKAVVGSNPAIGTFTYTISELSANTSYYVKTYATNNIGTSYGEQAIFITPTPVISLPSIGSLSGFKATKGTASALQTFTISATGLVSNLVVTAPSGFEVRPSGYSYFASSISLAPVSGVVTTTTIEVRISASALSTGIVFGNTVCSTAWTGDQIIAVSGEITQKQLTITYPTIVTNKMVDGNTTAAVTKSGTLQGIDAADAGNVGVTAAATYDNSNVGTNKTITVVYTLTGSSKDKYIAPANDTITNAKISDYVTLSTLSTPTPGCEGSYMDLPYTLLTGTPTQYKITFNQAALAAGMQNIVYQTFHTPVSSGDLLFYIPSNGHDGTYQGTLKMNNELNVESPDYPFTFSINVSADKIRTKFNKLVMFDNYSNRFTGYQWYKNNIEIAGATKQFYVDPAGLVGSYSLKLTTTDGSTLYSCPKVLNIPPVKVQVSTFPNPVKENESCTIQLSGLTDDQLRDTKLSVYNIQGVCVYESSVVKNITELNMTLSGVYIGHVTTTGIDNVFKIMVVK